ncbi:two-component system, chemotaxis family, response regulator CheB [Sphingomonas laterariae]|uniref:Protein-glutamate methylesterase/protein-glutamine glutaminase n=1 Tax=Edaphosphingomonas laterariae TaxID=861865 RepID=A0A239DAV9_9SPHN|nr:chemotaxis response regulator protein-glutamate methylesterase [Sphingomonas laterariae]SNS29459.1 two-component system, chemotaxis family, response regulator CheB [Sphingomonas laterariae]
MTVRTLIVDDSPTMRALLSGLLRRDPEIEVIGTADRASTARQMIKDLDPDVVTLDIEMPEMNGLDFLDKIMRLRPTPVVMVSTLTQAGADATLRALELGAVDCYPKPEGGMADLMCIDDGVLASKVKQAARSRRRPRLEAPVPVVPPTDFAWNGRYVAIGASTGGVEALGALLARFPENCPPTVIVQHMPALFTSCFATRLDNSIAPRVVEMRDDDLLEQGSVYIAPGGARHAMLRGSQKPHVRLIEAPPVNGHCPAVDVLFRSAAQCLGDRAVGIILTGMGNDGAQGLLEMRRAGASTLGQNEASSLIYGMPRVAAQIGAVEEELPLDRIARRALEHCSR